MALVRAVADLPALYDVQLIARARARTDLSSAVESVLPSLSPLGRSHAIWLLEGRQDPQSLTIAQDALRSPSASVRASGVGVLGQSGEPRFWTPLLAMASTADPQVFNAVIEALICLDSARATAEWLDWATTAPAERQVTVLERLLDEPETVGHGRLAPMLLGADDPVCALAAELAGRLGPDLDIDEALVEALHRPDERVRLAVLQALARREVTVDVSLLESVWASGVLGVRLGVVRASQHADPTLGVPFLVDRLGDPSPLVRVGIIETLGSVPADLVHDALMRGVPPQAPEVDQAALWRVMAKIGHPDDAVLKQRLVDDLRSGSAEVRTACLSATPRLLGAAARAHVLRSCTDADPAVRLRATRTLPQLPGAESEAALVQRLGDPEGRIRRDAIRGLRTLAARGALAAVEAQLAVEPLGGLRVELCCTLAVLRGTDGADRCPLADPAQLGRASTLWHLDPEQLAGDRLVVHWDSVVDVLPGDAEPILDGARFTGTDPAAMTLDGVGDPAPRFIGLPVSVRPMTWESRAFGPRRAILLTAASDPLFGGRSLRAVAFPDLDQAPLAR